MSIAIIAGLLYGFYKAYPFWKPYAPYLVDGNLLWLALAAATVNIFPSAIIGRTLHTGRFLFHHYVYGFFLLAIASIFIAIFTSVPLLSLFLVESNAVDVNAGRVFFLAGLALLLDDLPDVSGRVKAILDWIKTKTYGVREGLHIFQFVTGCFALYCCLSILLDSTVGGNTRALQNSFAVVSLFLTSLTSFACVKRKAWLKVTPPT
jgi:hypothetical protein